MMSSAKKIIGIVLPMAVLLISSYVLAHEQPEGDQTAGANQELPVAVPDLADIIPLATELSRRLAFLEVKVADGLDVSGVEMEYAGIEANLKGPADELQRLKDSKDYRRDDLRNLRNAVKQQDVLCEEISESLRAAINELGVSRDEWLAEKRNWSEWQSSLLKDEELDQLKSTFAKANDTIDKALNLARPQLEAMLTVQERGYNVHAKIYALIAELDGLIMVERRGALLDTSPSVFSPRYFSQFSSELWHSAQNGLEEIVWPDSEFFAREGLIVLLQGFISLTVIIALHRKRRMLQDSKRWVFLAVRPFSAGLFAGVMPTVLLYQYRMAPTTWILVCTIVGMISFARLAEGLVETSWKRQFVYGVAIAAIVTRLMHVINLPLPLFRICILVTVIVGFFFCLKWERESRSHKESGLYIWALRLVLLFLAVIIIAELLGKEALPSYLFLSGIRSVALVLTFMLFMHIIHGALEWVFHTFLIRRAVAPDSDIDAIIRQAERFIDVAICGLVLLPAILMLWGAYDSLKGATSGLLAVGFNLGSKRINLGLVIASAVILYGSFLASWILQRVLMDEALLRRRVEKGVRVSIGRLAHYAIVFVGFLLAISTLGFDVTKLTIVLSALGVGIGFGLQGIVNNFICGLILLFERPVRVGDIIEISGKWVEIKRMGLRATVVRTYEQSEIIIPNADLVGTPVTNWTLSNRLARLCIPVGVAYGSDIPRVMDTLMACAKENEKVAKTPEPMVLFVRFGENSLDFELLVWVQDADSRLRAQSELHQAVDRRFREAKIEIPFPQRDLHLRSMDESVALRPPETAE
jgi:small-conductance mechanosensitive channel